MAKRYEAKIEITTPRARSVKIYLLTPASRKTGKKTIEVVEVAASTASDTSMPPSAAASAGDFPSSMKRKMFSSTTTESSMRREKASARPPSSMVLIVPPVAPITSRQVSADKGMERSTAMVARAFPKKIRIMMPVSTRPMDASLTRFLIAPLPNAD